MAAIRTKYEQTKVYDPPVKSEVNSVQDIFSVEAIEESGILFCQSTGIQRPISLVTSILQA